MYTHLKPSIFKISGEKSIAELALYNALTFRGSYLRCNVIGQSIRIQLLIIHETGLGGRCLLTRSAIEKVHVLRRRRLRNRPRKALILDVWILGCTPVHILPGKLGSTAKSRSNRA